MAGRYEHKIELNIDKNGLKTSIELSHPCEELANAVNQDIKGMIESVEKNSKNILSEIAHLSHNLQISTLTSLGSNKTGMLANSITEEINGNSANIGTDLFYAQYVNDGRSSITGNPILHFYVGGEEVFVRSVGPSTPKPYLDISGDLLSMQIDNIIGAFLDNV